MSAPHIAHDPKVLLSPQAWEPRVQNGTGGHVRTQGVPQAVSRALAKIEPNEERRAFILAKITGVQPRNGSVNIVEPKALVETLDKVRITREYSLETPQALNLQLAQKVNDRAARESCLRVLSEVCRDHVILPESYVISNVSAEKRWKTGGAADVWTGKLGQEDVCIKVFRQHPSQQQEKIKGVGAISFCESVASLQIPPGVLLSRNKVEVCFARERAPFPRYLRGCAPFRHRQSSGVKYQHSTIHQ